MMMVVVVAVMIGVVAVILLHSAAPPYFTYARTMSAVATDGTSCAGWITDTTTNTRTVLGTITTPPMWLQNPLTFSEYYGPTEPSCVDFTESQATWANPTANDGTITSNVAKAGSALFTDASGQPSTIKLQAHRIGECSK